MIHDTIGQMNGWFNLGAMFMCVCVRSESLRCRKFDLSAPTCKFIQDNSPENMQKGRPSPSCPLSGVAQEAKAVRCVASTSASKAMEMACVCANWWLSPAGDASAVTDTLEWTGACVLTLQGLVLVACSCVLTLQGLVLVACSCCSFHRLRD